MQYDANKAPNPEEWLALDDAERIDLVIEYHRRHHLPLGGNANLHARAHAMVENQIAMGDVTVVPVDPRSADAGRPQPTRRDPCHRQRPDRRHFRCS
jgi:hypothetical protein